MKRVEVNWGLSVCVGRGIGEGGVIDWILYYFHLRINFLLKINWNSNALDQENKKIKRKKKGAR